MTENESSPLYRLQRLRERWLYLESLLVKIEQTDKSGGINPKTRVFYDTLRKRFYSVEREIYLLEHSDKIILSSTSQVKT